MAFSLAALAVVEGAAVRVGERAEGGLVEDPLEGLVAAERAPEEADLAGLAQHRRDAGGRGEGVGGAEAREGACLGDELGGEHGPHAGQAADEGGVRVAGEQRLELAVERGEPGAGRQRLDGEFPDQTGGHALARHGDVLLTCGGQRLVGQRLDMGHAAGGLEVAEKALGARRRAARPA